MTGIAAGRLNQRITIRRLSDAPDGKGGFIRDWTTFASRISAEVINQSGREAVIGATLTGVSTFRITTRMKRAWRAGGEAAPMVRDQVLWRGLELNIISPPADPNGDGDDLMFMADTSAPQGA